MKRSVLLIGLMLFGIVPMSVSAKPNDMRRAYEDGWKWYVYRKSQGADEGELLDILQTLKQKYGHTYFNMERVDRALDELGSGTQNDAQAPAENFLAPADYSPAVVTQPAPAAPKAIPAFQSPPAATAPAIPKAESAAPASQDPFERYMASQRAQLKTKEEPQPATVVGSKSAPAAAVASVPVTNPAAQAKIEELSSPDETVRVKAAQALGEMREPGAVGALMELFKGDSTFASMAASSALAKIGLPAVKPLIASLQDPNPNVRIGACVALGDMNDPAIAPALQKLTLDRDSRVRKAAATALSKTKTGK